jgi:uncharacterized protein YxjI
LWWRRVGCLPPSAKRWFRIRDTYGIEIRQGEDDALILALAVAIDDMGGE